jgi:ribonuclease Z
MGKGQDTATNTSCYIQVLGVGTDTGCTVPSALLFFDRNRYLFNAGEGFQRFCVEHKIRMTKLTAILTTRVNTEATGGLPGMLLTMADTTAGGLLTGHAGMTVHGPPGLHTLVNGFRTFVNVKDMGLKIMEFGSGAAKKKKVADGAATEVPAADHAVKEPLPVAEILSRPAVKNEAVSIVPIIIRPTPSPTDLAANGSKADDAEPSEKRQKTEHGTASHSISAILAAASSMDIPSTAVDSAAACYVCELPDIPGKFLPHKAASLGVPRGPLYGQLARGQEVTAVNGRVVRPEDVMEPSAPGPTIAVVDCPTAAFLQGLADTTNGLGAWAADENKRSRGKKCSFELLFSFGVVVPVEF